MNHGPGYCSRYAILVLFLLQCISSVGQTTGKHIIKTTRLTVQDGLVSNMALCGLQDSRGFIWIGTTEGLQRYDGRAFRLFNREGGLHANKIASMAEDKDGQLWLQYGSSEDALLRNGRFTELLDSRTYRIRTLAGSFGKSLPFPPEELKWFFSDEQHNLFLITGNNAVWWYRGGGSFKKLIDEHRHFDFYPHGSLYQAWGGTLWLSSNEVVLCVDTLGHLTQVKNPGADRLNNVLHINRDQSCIAFSAPRSRDARAATPYEPPVLYQAGADGSARVLPYGFFDGVHLSTFGDYLLEFRADVRTRNVMLHNPHIGLQLLTDTGTILLIDTATLALEAPLSPYAYFTDRGGGHWLCTSLGVYRFSITPTYFQNFLTRIQLPAATAVANQARGIWEADDGSVFIGRDALFQVGADGAPVRRVADGPVMAVQGADTDFLWYTTYDGIYRISKRDGQRTKIRTSLATNQVPWCIHQGRNGIRYAGGDQFIGYFRDDSLIMMNPCPDTGRRSSCYQFFEDRAGRLWAVTDAGLYEVKGSCYTPLQISRELPSRRLYYVYEAPDGRWWLCTAGDGLICWDPRTGVYRRYTTASGLPSGTLYALLPDGRGHFWISSNNGLFRFNPQDGTVRTFTEQDGLPHNEFNRISYYRSPRGRLYFGGLNGVTAFYPDAIPADRSIAPDAPMQVISLRQYSASEGKLVDLTDSLPVTGRITLEPGDKFLTLEVALLDFSKGQGRYSYLLQGMDTNWRYSDGTIQLDNLPYGSYTLRIRGQSAAGTWSREELHLPLVVKAPFYKQPLFLFSIGMLGALLLFAIVRARLRMLRLANWKLEQTVDQRTRELRETLAHKEVLMKEIHHRVKNNLQVISALQQMQASRSTDPHVKAALEESQNRVLSIAFIHHNLYQHDDLKGVEMSSFITELSGHINEVFSRPGCTIEVAQDIPELYLDIDTAVPLGLIINELLTNAYKYAFTGKADGWIDISIAATGAGKYAFSLRDNGAGLPQGLDIMRAKSLGLRLVSQLSRQLGGSMQYQYDGGSRFSLLFEDYEVRNAQ